MNLLVALSLLSVVTALTCSLPGVFLVVRHQSMLVDAMSHAVFPGIVIGALISGSAHSPVMIILASGMGLLVVIAAERFKNSGLVTSDAATGLIFPVLFALGIALLSSLINNVHLSEASVLTGELNLMALPSERLIIGSFDLGPAMIWPMLGVFTLSTGYILLTYRVLLVSSFDPNMARTIGLPADAVNLGLMTLVSLTTVVTFSTVGAILVVALMIVPAATARLLTTRLSAMIVVCLGIAAGTALLGLWLAYLGDLATAPMMAFTDGIVFLAVLAFTQTRFHTRRRTASVTSSFC